MDLAPQARALNRYRNLVEVRDLHLLVKQLELHSQVELQEFRRYLHPLIV